MVTNPSSTVKSAVGNNVYNTLTNYIYSWITVNNNSNNNNSAQSVSNRIRGTNSMTGNKRQSCYMSKELDQPISLIRSQIQYSHTRLTNSAIYFLTQLALVTERAIRHRGNVYGSTRPSSATPSLSGQGSPRSASHSSLSSNNSNNSVMEQLMNESDRDVLGYCKYDLSWRAIEEMFSVLPDNSSSYTDSAESTQYYKHPWSHPPFYILPSSVNSPKKIYIWNSFYEIMETSVVANDTCQTSGPNPLSGVDTVGTPGLGMDGCDSPECMTTSIFESTMMVVPVVSVNSSTPFASTEVAPPVPPIVHQYDSYFTTLDAWISQWQLLAVYEPVIVQVKCSCTILFICV